LIHAVVGPTGSRCFPNRERSALARTVGERGISSSSRYTAQPRSSAPGFCRCTTRPGFSEHPERLGPIAKARGLRGQAFEVFVDLEELLDLGPEGSTDVIDLDDLRAHRVAQRDAHELVVGAFSSTMRKTAIVRTRIRQPGKLGSPTRTSASRGSAVLAERPFDEAVVGGVNGRGEEAPVKDDRVELRGPANRQVVLPS
jgi:hypothetical protein